MTTTTVQIPGDLRGCHALITKTRGSLKLAKTDERNLKRAAGDGVLKVCVSRESIDRALKILEAIIRACEARGWSVAAPDARSSAEIRIGDDPVSFGISEKIARFEIKTDDPAKDKWYWRPRYRYQSTGLLTVEIFDYLGDGMRRSWSDGKRQRLEELLSEFIDGAERASAALRARRLEREEWERQYRLEELRRQELALRIKKEIGRREQLATQLKGWSQANALRQIIAELQQRRGTDSNVWPSAGVTHWLHWAEGMLRRFDPFLNGYFSNALIDDDADAGLDCEQAIYC
jgi:hypothetical protein